MINNLYIFSKKQFMLHCTRCDSNLDSGHIFTHLSQHGENADFNEELRYLTVICDSEAVQNLIRMRINFAFEEYSHMLRVCAIPVDLIPTLEMLRTANGISFFIHAGELK